MFTVRAGLKPVNNSNSMVQSARLNQPKPCLPVFDFMTSVQVNPKPELSVFSYLLEDHEGNLKIKQGVPKITAKKQKHK